MTTSPQLHRLSLKWLPLWLHVFLGWCMGPFVRQLEIEVAALKPKQRQFWLFHEFFSWRWVRQDLTFSGGLRILHPRQTLSPMVAPTSQFTQTHPWPVGEGFFIGHQLAGGRAVVWGWIQNHINYLEIFACFPFLKYVIKLPGICGCGVHNMVSGCLQCILLGNKMF